MTEVFMVDVFEFNGWEIKIDPNSNVHKEGSKGAGIATIISPSGDVLTLCFSNKVDDLYAESVGWFTCALDDAWEHMTGKEREQNEA